MSNLTDDHRLEAFERAVQDIRDAVVAIARLEERHQETRDALGRAFDRIDDVERDQASVAVTLARIEGQMEPLKEARKWVISGVLAVVGLVGAAVVGLVMVK